jgi:hypothetical protein
MNNTFVIIIAAVFAMVGCATTRVVSKQPKKGGVIAL